MGRLLCLRRRVRSSAYAIPRGVDRGGGVLRCRRAMQESIDDGAETPPVRRHRVRPRVCITRRLDRMPWGLAPTDHRGKRPMKACATWLISLMALLLVLT